MAAVIETTGLTKRFGRVIALDRVDLEVAAGSVFGVIGPNGAGKTTMMRVILDIMRPTSGSVRVLGVAPGAGGPELRRRIGFLPGDLRLEPRVTGADLLRHYERISGPVAPGEARAIADRLGLDLSRSVHTLSKGNRQKLGVVQAFMHRPDLLVLDEPTSGLDPLVQQEFLAMVGEARDRGQTVFLSSHVLSEIQQAADAVAILRDGRIVTVSDVESLRLTAIRHVRVGVADADAERLIVALGGLPQLTRIVRVPGAGTRIDATVTGGIDPFVKAIAAFEVGELTVEEPDLEESVLRLYGAAAQERREVPDGRP